MQFVFELRPVNWRLKLAASETPATYPRHKGSLGPATLRGPHQVVSSLPSTKRPLGYWALACMVNAHNKAQARIDRIEIPTPKPNQSLSMMRGGTEGNSWPSHGSAQRSLCECASPTHLRQELRSRSRGQALIESTKSSYCLTGRPAAGVLVERI